MIEGMTMVVGRRAPGRIVDEATYVVERRPPFRVVDVCAVRDLPISPALIGMPAALIIHSFEPEQPTLCADLVRAFSVVRPGEPIVRKYRAARYQNRVRVAEVVDRGPTHAYLYVFCHDEPPTPTDPVRDGTRRRRGEEGT
jgi:hypothetical protein